MSGQALITSPFGVGAVVTTLIALTFWRDRRFRLFSFLGTARHGGDHEVVVLWSSARLEPSRVDITILGLHPIVAIGWMVTGAQSSIGSPSYAYSLYLAEGEFPDLRLGLRH